MCSPFGESNGKCICAAQWCVQVAVVRRFSSASLVRFVVGVERQKAFFYYKNPKAAFSACPFFALIASHSSPWGVSNCGVRVSEAGARLLVGAGLEVQWRSGPGGCCLRRNRAHLTTEGW